MSSDNPLKEAAEGATKATLDWTSEKITDFIKKFKEKKLAFIQDKKTIETAKEVYNSGEAQFYNKYIKNQELLFIVKMGLALRKLENDEERLHNLRDKIFKKYKVKGLQIAELVQNEILNRYIGILLGELPSITDLEKNIEELLNNIEKHTVFVKGENNEREIIKKSINITDANSPFIFIVSGTKSASETVKKCIDKLRETLKEYNLERISGNEKEILFFKRIIK